MGRKVGGCASKGWGEQSLERTRMCRQFLRRGSCRNGQQCRFAHSGEERRAKPDLQGTVLCPQLICTGACTQMDCRFAHNAAEFRGTITPQPMLTKDARERSESPDSTAASEGPGAPMTSQTSSMAFLCAEQESDSSPGSCAKREVQRGGETPDDDGCRLEEALRQMQAVFRTLDFLEFGLASSHAGGAAAQ